MSAIVLILLAIVIFVAGYLTYGKYLAKTWGLDPEKKTPAHTMEDGVDYVAVPFWVTGPVSQTVYVSVKFATADGSKETSEDALKCFGTS